MISRFNREGAVTISDVLNSAPPFNDELPNLDYSFVKRDTTNRAFSNPSRLSNPTDMLNLQLYWLEFLGDGDRARADENFLAQKLKNMMGRLNSNWDKRILAQFDFEWTKRSAINAEITNPYYIVWMNDIRKQANDYWKDGYNSSYTCHNKGSTTVPGRYERIEALKKIYKGDWDNYIWRILDIDDIGMFFDEYNPIYKKCEEDKKKKINNSDLRGYGLLN
jgi:hypothetical protein